jgi:hypothetical protein
MEIEMAKYRKKPVVIEAISFDELLDFGRANAANIVHGMPWSFTYQGHPISHENDDCYLIPTLEGTMKMGRDDMLITGVKGEIYPCKADIFAATYDRADQPHTNMNFGDALAALKDGAKVARAGWNGKGMWIALTPGSAFEARYAKCGHAAAKRADEMDDPDGDIELLPHIDMRAADGCMVVGWLASQTDMLADDWQIVP